MVKLGDNDPPIADIKQWGEQVIVRDFFGRLSFGLIVEVGEIHDTIWLPTGAGGGTVSAQRAATSEISKLGVWEYVLKDRMLP